MAEAAANTTTKPSTKKSTGTRKSSTTKKTPRLYEREPKVLAEEATYVTAALLDGTIEFVKALPTRVEELREQAPARVSELREQAPSKVEELRTQLEASVKDLREKATRSLDQRLAAFEKEFDARAKAGKKVTTELRKDERVSRVESQLNKIWEQTENSRSQVKAAYTSVRKTVDTVVDAGKDLASNGSDEATEATEAAS